MAFITVTNSFTNSTTADASAVNTNFSDVINGTSDGTKDFSIAALTLSSTFTANGNVNLGNASSDDVIITGSLAATLPIKTNTSFDFGSSTLGLRYLYLGGTSTFTGRLGAATLSASRTFTFPECGADSELVVTQGTVSITAGTTTLTTACQTVLCNTSGGAITVNLPAAASFAKKKITIKKTSSDLTLVTIDGNASETIDGATTYKLAFQYESVTLLCDGSNWHIEETYKPRVTGKAINTSSTGFGTATTVCMDFSSVTYDSHGLITNEGAGPLTSPNSSAFKLFAPKVGRMHVRAYIQTDSGGGWAAGERLEVYLNSVSSGQEMGVSYSQATHTTNMVAIGSDTQSCTEGEYKFILVTQYSGGTLAMSTNSHIEFEFIY